MKFTIFQSVCYSRKLFSDTVGRILGFYRYRCNSEIFAIVLSAILAVEKCFR